MSKIELEVYIFFKGECKEAMEFYKSVFGGELETNPYDEKTKMPGVGDGWVMHSTLSGGDIKLMGSDTTKASPLAKKISLTLGGTDEAHMRGVFDKLSAGGKVQFALEKQFWGDIYGSFTDKFGVEWMMDIGSST